MPDSAKLNLGLPKFAANIEKRGFENFRYYIGPFIQFYGAISFVDFMTDTLKLVSEKDAQDYIKRISKIPNAIEQLMVFEKRAEAGIYSPKFVYEKTLLQLASLIETPTDQHPLFITFKDASESMDLENDKKEKKCFLTLKIILRNLIFLRKTKKIFI